MFLKSQPCGERQADARGAWAHQPRLPVEFQASGGPCLPATVLSLCTAALSLHFFPGSPELSGMKTEMPTLENLVKWSQRVSCAISDA